MIRTPEKNSARNPIVVKLGGSLYNCIPELVPVLRASGRPLFIVPGGGPFADRIRRISLEGEAAHWMAVAAMDQYGWYLAANGMDVTARLQVPARPIIFLPYCCMRKHDPLPHSWDITSDSIAAWTASVLGLELLLLKSVDGIEGTAGVQEEVAAPIKTETVDPFFIPYVLKHRIKTTIINGSQVTRVRNFLQGDPVPGTRICTTF